MGKKTVLSVKLRAELGADTSICHTSALLSDTQINAGAVTTAIHKHYSLRQSGEDGKVASSCHHHHHHLSTKTIPFHSP